MSTFVLGGAVSNQSAQGALSSQYTNWVESQVQSAADAIAYKWFHDTGDLDTAIAIRDALQHGEFSVNDLFLAANAKSTFGAHADLAGQPDPKLVVAGQTIDISDLFSGTEVTQWTSGNAKNVQYHAREYFTSFDAGTAPEGWDHPPKPNQAPTATAVHVDATETLSQYDTTHHITNLGEDLKVVQLINGVASDPDGDALNIVTGSVVVNGGGGLPSYIKVVGNTLTIDQNDRALDELLKGDVKEIKLSYQITDGINAPITNTVTIDITGTEDQFNKTGDGSVSQTHLRSDSTTGGGNINGNVLSFSNPVPSDAIEFHFSGTLTAQQTGLAGNQKVNVADATPTDWGAGAINLTADHPSDTVTLSGTALNDLQVNYNVGFNTGDATDAVKVTLDYHYDYWYVA